METSIITSIIPYGRKNAQVFLGSVCQSNLGLEAKNINISLVAHRRSHSYIMIYTSGEHIITKREFFGIPHTILCLVLSLDLGHWLLYELF